MAEILRATDTIRGNSAEAQVIINGIIHRMFYAKDFEANIEKKKTEIATLGRMMVGHKTGQLKGSGKMTIYYTTSYFRKMIEEFKSSGRDVYFQLIVSNDDPESTMGSATTAFYNCNINGITLSKFNVGDDILEETVDFTFDDYEHLAHFNENPDG